MATNHLVPAPTTGPVGRVRSHTALFLVVAAFVFAVALAVPPVIAAATGGPAKDYSKNGATGDYAPPKVFKDYSKNGATGDYAPPKVFKDYSKNGATGDYSLAVAGALPTAVIAKQPQEQSFAWGAAALGAGTTLVLVMVCSLMARRVRRRRLATRAPARPTAA